MCVIGVSYTQFKTSAMIGSVGEVKYPTFSRSKHLYKVTLELKNSVAIGHSHVVPSGGPGEFVIL